MCIKTIPEEVKKGQLVYCQRCGRVIYENIKTKRTRLQKYTLHKPLAT